MLQNMTSGQVCLQNFLLKTIINHPTSLKLDMVLLLFCLCLTFHQQLMSLGDGATAKVSSNRLVILGIEPAIPGLQRLGKWFIHYTMTASGHGFV